MSELTNSDSPLVEGKPNTGHTSSVGSGVIQDKPCAGGLNSILNTQRSMGITESLVSSGNLFLTKDGVKVSALPPGGVKEGNAQQYQFSQQAQYYPAKYAQQHSTASGQAQSTVTKNILPDHTATQFANYLNTASMPQDMGTSQSIPGTTKYNFILPSGKPINPMASILDPKLVTSNTSCKSLGESIGLENSFTR